jgi:hypothetical protein
MQLTTMTSWALLAPVRPQWRGDAVDELVALVLVELQDEEFLRRHPAELSLGHATFSSD